MVIFWVWLSGIVEAFFEMIVDEKDRKRCCTYVFSKVPRFRTPNTNSVISGPLAMRTTNRR